MKSLFKQSNIYTLIWCLYYFQGVLYPEGSIISQALLAVFLLMSFYYFFLCCSIYSLPKVMRVLKYLVILFGVYGLIRVFADTTGWMYVNASTTYFKEYELSILPVFAFYYFSRKGFINSDWFYKFTFIFLIIAVANFNYQEIIALQKTTRDETTNNAGYFVVSMLPLLVFLKRKPLIQYLVLFIIFIYVLKGMKRGAIIVCIIASCYFLFELFKKAKGRKKILFIFMGCVAVLLGFVYFNYQLETSDYMQMRLERTKDGDMSDRENMYPMFFNYFINNAGIEWLIGYGADGTLKELGDFAHMDWLEVLINHGLLGVFLLMLFWITTISTAIKSRLTNTPNLTIIISLFILIYLFKSFISMSINGMTVFATSALGYALAGLQNEKIRLDLNN